MSNISVLLLLLLTQQTLSALPNLLTKNRSRPRRSNMTKVSFYPFEFNSQDADKNYSSKKDKPMYVYPEPGCTCIPTMRDFEHCYCKLGCPLIKSTDTNEKWLTSLYGDLCHNRKKHVSSGSKKAPTFRQRQQELSKRIILACDRPDYHINNRLPFYQFICVLIDNSRSTSQYNSRPARVDHIGLMTLTKMKYTWPIFQTLYTDNKCPPEKISGQADLESDFSDDNYLFQKSVNELFLRAPPPLNSPNLSKFPLNREKICLSERKFKGDALIDKAQDEDKMQRPQNLTTILGDILFSILYSVVFILAYSSPSWEILLGHVSKHLK